MRHAGDMKNRIFVFEGIKACVVAERAFGAQFVEVDVAFEHDFGIRRNLEIDRLAFH